MDGPATEAQETTGRSRVRGWRQRRSLWAALIGLGLLALFLLPALHAGYRGDDAFSSENNGLGEFVGRTLPEQLWTFTAQFWRSGRPQVLAVYEGFTAAWVLGDDPVLYHAYLILTTVMTAALLFVLVRRLGLSAAGGLLVLVLLAGAIQFRSYHDAQLGYWGTIQILLSLTFASLIVYLRWLRDGGRGRFLVSLLLFLPVPLLYEGSYTLVALYLGLALHERRGWAAWRASAVFLAYGVFFVVLSLYLRSIATAAAENYQPGGGPAWILRTYVIQLFPPLPGSNLIFGDFSPFIPTGNQPTSAELLAGLWRGAVVFGVVLVLSLRMVWDGGARLVSRRAVGGIAITGALLWLAPVLIVSVSPKYQIELSPGKGHLPLFIQVFGWSLVAAAVLFTALRGALRRSFAAAVFTALAGAGLLGAGAGVVGYNNLRVVALEQPIIETRALLEHASADGVFSTLPDGASIVMSPRDMGWPTGNWTQVPESLEAMLVDKTDRRYDGRIPLDDKPFNCPVSEFNPPRECEPLDARSVWVRVRAHRGGGSVIVASLPAIRSGNWAAATTRTLRVYAQGDEARAPLALTGGTAAGRPWNADGLRWRTVASGDDWSIREATITGAPPIATSLDDARGAFDFTNFGTPGGIVRIYGTKRLLP